MQQNSQVSEGNILLGLFSPMTSQHLPQGFRSLQDAGVSSNFESLLHGKIAQYESSIGEKVDINHVLESFPAALDMAVEIPGQALPSDSTRFVGGSTSQVMPNSNGQETNTDQIVLPAGGKTFPQEQQILQMRAGKVGASANFHIEPQPQSLATDVKGAEQLNAMPRPQTNSSTAHQLAFTASSENPSNFNPVPKRTADTFVQKNPNQTASATNNLVNQQIEANANQLPPKNGNTAAVSGQPTASESVIQDKNRFADNPQFTGLNMVDGRLVANKFSPQQNSASYQSVLNQDAVEVGTAVKTPLSNIPSQQNPTPYQPGFNQRDTEIGVAAKTASDLSNEVTAIVEKQGVKPLPEKIPNLSTPTDRQLPPGFVSQVKGEESDIPAFLKLDTSREMSEGQLSKIDLINLAKEPAGSQINTTKPATQIAANNFAVEVAEPLVEREGLTETNPLKSTADKLQNLPLSVAVNQRGWGDAFSSRIQWLASNNVNTAEIRLDPAHLGKIEVQIDLSGPEAKVIFNAEHAQAREALDNAMPRLREMMSESGFQQLNVDISGQERKGEERHASGDAQTDSSEQATNAELMDETEQALVTTPRNILDIGNDSDNRVDFYA